MEAPEIVYKVSKCDLKDAMIETLQEVAADSILKKYEGRLVGKNAACEVLGIGSATLYRYIDRQLLVPVDRTGRDYAFDLRYLLEFNITEIKRKRLYLKK